MQTLRKFDYQLAITRILSSNAVEKAVSALEVKSVTFDQEKSTLTVVAYDNQITEKQLTETIRNAGASVLSVTIIDLPGNKL